MLIIIDNDKHCLEYNVTKAVLLKWSLLSLQLVSHTAMLHNVTVTICIEGTFGIELVNSSPVLLIIIIAF